MKPSYTKHELDEWENGARNARMGFSLSQSYKHLNRYDHDMRNVHKDGWIAMKEYLKLKEIDEELS